MFEGESEVVPSTGAGVVSSAGSSVLQAGQNISTSGDALAQEMSKALTDSLPGFLAALRNHNAVPSQPAPPNSNPAVISTSSPAPLTQASLGQATTTGNFIVPSFVSTISTLSTPAYGFSSLLLPSSSGSPTVGGGVVSAFPVMSVSSAVVRKDFPHKLVTNDNLKATTSKRTSLKRKRSWRGNSWSIRLARELSKSRTFSLGWRRLQSIPSSCVLLTRLDGLIYRTTSCSSSRRPEILWESVATLRHSLS